jgi:hypothetical protein
MSEIAYALTSDSSSEIRKSILTLKASASATGFMHESYNRNNSAIFTRAWFAWANSLFGELIGKTAKYHPEILG